MERWGLCCKFAESEEMLMSGGAVSNELVGGKLSEEEEEGMVCLRRRVGVWLVKRLEVEEI